MIDWQYAVEYIRKGSAVAGIMCFLHTRARPEMLDDALWPCEDRCE